MIADYHESPWRRLNNKVSEILDQSAIRRRREDRDDLDLRSGNNAGNTGGVNLPSSLVVGVVLYLITSGIGGVWWAATMQSKVDNLQADNTRLWQKVETHDLQISHSENGLDERIHTKVRETLADWGYLHVLRKGE